MRCGEEERRMRKRAFSYEASMMLLKRDGRFCRRSGGGIKNFVVKIIQHVMLSNEWRNECLLGSWVTLVEIF
jgi:hypothetical protein